MDKKINWLKVFIAMMLVACFAGITAAQECGNRGILDPMYCDEDKDLVADPPMDPKQWKNPGTLIFTYTPVEDPVVYRDLFTDFLDYLSKATGKRVAYYTDGERRRIYRPNVAARFYQVENSVRRPD